MNARSTAVRIAILLAASALLAGTAAAGGLPKGARKLSTAQVKALYSGHTAVWKKSKEYFVPDGTVRHVKNDGTLYGVGKWHARGNTVCSDLTWHSLKDGSSGKMKDCWSWARKGGTYYTEWKGSDGSSNGWYTSEAGKLRKGDLVTPRWKKAKAKAGS